MSHLVTRAVDVQGQVAELEAGLAQTQCSIIAAQERHQRLQSQRSQLKQRCSNSCAALDAMKSITSMVTSVPADAPSAPARSFPDESTKAPVATLPSTLPSAPPVSTVLVTTVHRQHKGLFEHSSTVPPPLTAYHHRRTISVEHLKAFARCRDHTALQPGADGSSPAACRFSIRKLTQEFRSSEAVQCGCGVHDIAWFSTTNVNVVADSTAGTAGVMCGADCDVGSSISEMLSFSTTFNAGPCIASFFVMFLHIALESTLSQRAAELLKGTPPGLLPRSHALCCATELSAKVLLACMPQACCGAHGVCTRSCTASGPCYQAHMHCTRAHTGLFLNRLKTAVTCRRTHG